jgi:hypothetical protein
MAPESTAGRAGETKRPVLSEAERNAEERRRRAEVLALPMTPLRLHGYLENPSRMLDDAIAAGVGPDGTALAVWHARDTESSVLVTRHQGKDSAVSHVQLATGPRVQFVQPLPDGQTLIITGAAKGEENAEIWTADGRREHLERLGSCISRVLTTRAGSTWVGYGDQAADSGAESHGLVRFDQSLQSSWLYPYGAGTVVFDAYAVNVSGEDVYCCPYYDFHLLSVTGDHLTDHGHVPVHGAVMLLVDGDRAALIGGYGPDYDLITPLSLTSKGVQPAGRQSRLVLPDGREILEQLRGTKTCRGSDLHLIDRWERWYRISLDDLWPDD